MSVSAVMGVGCCYRSASDCCDRILDIVGRLGVYWSHLFPTLRENEYVTWYCMEAASLSQHMTSQRTRGVSVPESLTR